MYVYNHEIDQYVGMIRDCCTIERAVELHMRIYTKPLPNGDQNTWWDAVCVKCIEYSRELDKQANDKWASDPFIAKYFRIYRPHGSAEEVIEAECIIHKLTEFFSRMCRWATERLSIVL